MLLLWFLVDDVLFRDLARADLESAQLMVYNLRSEIDEMENQLREEQVRSFVSSNAIWHVLRCFRRSKQSSESSIWKRSRVGMQLCLC